MDLYCVCEASIARFLVFGTWTMNVCAYLMTLRAVAIPKLETGTAITVVTFTDCYRHNGSQSQRMVRCTCNSIHNTATSTAQHTICEKS